MRSRRSWAAGAGVVSAALVIAVARPVAAGTFVGNGVSAPPPFPTEPVPAADGPVVAAADPFTLDASGLAPGQIEMTTLSTRPSLVSGGRVRVEVRGLAADDTLSVLRNGADVSSAFAPVPGRPSVRGGVVNGLHFGANTLVATVSGAGHGSRSATLVVVDHPLDGPVISGAHQEPFVCETAASGMGASSNADCDAPTTDHWYARSAVTQQFTQLSDPYAAYPPETATTMANGHSVPFVVRVETTIINRSITHIAVLDDPHTRGASKPFTPSEWNQRLLYVFGESCGTGYDQGVVHEADVLGDANAANENYALAALADLPSRLGRGYMVTLSSLTTLGVHCNPLLSAETATMVKEHIIDDYGLPVHTIGMGGSGGAIQQHTTANMYPGVIDAATPILSFPDPTSTAVTVIDCHLFQRVFNADPNRWSVDKQTAVTGLADPNVCKDWDTEFFPVVEPIPSNCPAGIPASQIYDAHSNPHGVRCDIQDGQKVIWGVDPATGFGNRPWDNIGVQYGLAALNDGAISIDDFMALNQAMGGLDIDAHPTASRTAMSAIDAQIAFGTGEVTGRGALDQIPIIDQSAPVIDFTPDLDIHDQVRPFEMRARLDTTFGSHANQAIWSAAPLPSAAVPVAEEWLNDLDAYTAAHPGTSRAAAVAASRPADAADDCQVGVTGVPGACDRGIDRHASPRQVAGGPLSEDVLKCQLRAVDAHDYSRGATPAQLATLRVTFAAGVCDWSKQSVGAAPRSQTWLSWGAGDPGTTPVTVPYPLVRSAVRSAVVAAATTAAAATQLPNTSAPGGAAVPLVLLLGGAVTAATARRRRRRWGRLSD